MKKILLIGINARYSHSNPALRLLRESGRETADISLLEISINMQLPEALDKINTGSFDIYAFSVYIWNSAYVKNILPSVHRAHPSAQIILGGPEVSYDAESWLAQFDFVSHIALYEGETAFKEICGGTVSPDEKIVRRKNPPFDSIPFAYREDDIAALKNKYVYYEASRGCPFACSYCLSAAGGSRGVEFRTPARIQSELEFFITHGVDTVKFVDRTFNAERQQAHAVWKFLMNRNAPVRFHFEIHPALLSDDDIQLLSDAPPGMFQFEIGIQSLNEKTCEAIHRTHNWPHEKEMIQKLTARKNIHVHVDLIAGLPFEGMNEFKNSFNEVYALGADYIQLGFLKVLPGTEMHRRTAEFGIVRQSDAPYEVISTSWMQQDELLFLKKIESALDHLYNTGRFTRELSDLAAYFDSPFDLFSELALFSEWNFSGGNRKQFHAQQLALFLEKCQLRGKLFPRKN